MSDYNQITFTGRLTADPETKLLGSGKTVTNFSVACNEYNEDAAGYNSVIFLRCETWEKTAEFAGEYLRKGSQVLISGRLRQQNWRDDNGEQRTNAFVTVYTVQALGGNVKKDNNKKNR